MASNSIWDLWNKWNIRSFVMLSLLLQIFLILFAPLRKKMANQRLIFLLWLAYLMADWVAAFGIGMVSHSQGNSSNHVAEVDGALQAFWASFLLLHLGGPDTITAFSLEDNSLWQRHMLSLIFQVSAAIYVFMQIFPNNNLLIIPTMLVFLAGVIKNAERTYALYLSSLLRLRKWVLSPEESLSVELKDLVKELTDPGNGESYEEEAKLAESIVVKHAYCFFHICKVFLADLIFTREERAISHEYFHKVSAVDALRVISIELQFMYEMLHTKALAIRSKCSYIFRFTAFINVVVSLVLFSRLKKNRLPKLDVKITYSLLFGAIALDVMALFMLVLSDRTLARIKWCNRGSSKLDSFFHKLASVANHLRKPRFAPYEAELNANVAYVVLDTPLIFRRWSESISACNLLSMSLGKSPRKIYKHNRCWGITTFSNICSFPLKIIANLIHRVGEAIAISYDTRNLYEKIPMIANACSVSRNFFVKELWVFIFKEVKRKSENVNDLTEVKMIFEARGDLFLESKPGGIDCSNLLVYVNKVNYDDSIIMWHIATEIWYNREKPTIRNDKRKFSKILSDYMLYLLLNQSNVVSAVAGIAQMTSGETLRELRLLTSDLASVEELCEKLFAANVTMFPSKFPLSKGVRLAKEMERLGETKWEVMSGVWVEMLSYAAVHIKGEAHAQVLSKGGELLAFVWLLMAHFGCFCKPEWGMYYEDWDEIFWDYLLANVDNLL